MKQRNSYLNLSFCLLFFGLSLTYPTLLSAQPSNDTCEGAIMLDNVSAFCSSAAEFNNTEANPELTGSSCFSDGKDVWYQFRAINPGVRIEINGEGNGGSLARPEVQLFNTGQCGNSFEVLDCIGGNFSHKANLDVGGLIAGNTYLFRVQGRNDGEGTFQICIDNYPSPINDLCGNAFIINDVTNYCSDDGEFSNIDAFKEVNLSSSSCLSSEGSDVWFQFRAINPGLRISVEGQGLGGSIIRPEIQLFNQNTCRDEYDIIECVAGTTNNEANLDVGGLTVGSTYLFRVQGRKGEVGTFKLCLDNFPSPINDDCEGAIRLSNVSNYRSDPREFSSIDASAGPVSSGFRCLESSNDVWFSFVAEASDIVVTVTGDIASEFPGGSLRRPEVEVYSIISCPNDITSLGCNTDGENENIVILREDGLRVGSEYLIRVQGRDDNVGTFQLDVTNFTPSFPPESDCVDARLLCDKSLVRVEVLNGGGDDPDEARNSCLGEASAAFGQVSESNSTWYKWIAGNNEPLTFVLNPDTYEDDIDWVLYKLPGGIDDCGNKEVLRCMASGQNNGGPVSEWRACVGPTGLRDGEDDIEEDAGCTESDDNSFLAPIILEENVAYALLINFFDQTSTTTGFSLEFGGTGIFQGLTPVPEILNDATMLCVGEAVSYTGANSVFIFGEAEISDYEWSFGVGAEPPIANGAGPHQVRYNSPGDKSVVLTLTSSRFGCKAEELTESIVTIESCCNQNGLMASSRSTDEICGQLNGTIDLTVESDFPYSTKWNSGSNDEDLDNLEEGLYVVTITNTANCTDTIPVVIREVLPFEVNSSTVTPSCNGGTDGRITLDIATTDPVTLTWDNPDFVGSELNELAEGDYGVTILDSRGCTQDLLIELKELALELDAPLDNIQNPSCADLSDGRIELAIQNGRAPYTYNWEAGIAATDANQLTDLAQGTYKVTVVDQDNCTGELDIELVAPSALDLILVATDVSCGGNRDGNIETTISGGAEGYRFIWNNGASIQNLNNLDTGFYELLVRDANDCEIEQFVSITEPAELFLELVDVENVLCNGDGTGVINVEARGGNPAYEYSVSGSDFQPSAAVGGLSAGTYTIIVQDQRDCSAQITATVDEPEALVVSVATESQIVNLGKSTDLTTRVSPSSQNVDYEWFPPEFVSCINCPDPTAAPVINTSFVVTVTDEDNCTATDSLLLVVNPNRELYIPSAFSPDFDGINDYFTLYGGASADFISQFYIYDRWGNLVFERTNVPLGEANVGWDGIFNGRAAPIGVYAYYALVRFIDGQEVVFEGDVTIVR